jgi:uncharacterized protein (TIGR02118 family)
MILTVLYPAKSGDHFDYDYYVARHTPLVREAWKPEDVKVFRGVAGVADSEIPYRLVAHIRFASTEALEAALASERTPEVFADVAKFTDIEPVAMITTSLA